MIENINANDIICFSIIGVSIVAVIVEVILSIIKD